MSEQFKIIFLPSNTSKIREYNFSKIKLILFSMTMSILLFLILIYGVSILTDVYYNSKLEKLNKDRLIFRGNLLQMQNTVNELKKEFEIIIQMDDEARTFADLPQFDEDIREAGTGGGVRMKPFLSSFYSEEDGISSSLIFKLEKLERQIEIERESYSEIYERLKINRDMIRYWPSIRPVTGGRISDGYGRRKHPINGNWENHRAIDISVPRGTPVYAAADGTVLRAGKNGPYGNYVKIDHNSKEYGYMTCYGHLHKIFVKKRETVKRGDVIGEVGNTGLSTASHLHYEVLYNGNPVDPVEYYYDYSVLY